MSTDDLTEALRIAGQCRGFADPSRSERATIALADEVDRLRAENGRAYRAGLQDRDAEWDRQQDYYEVSLAQERRLAAELDAARAALGRVTDLLPLWARLASQQANLGDVVHDLTRALEGEPS